MSKGKDAYEKLKSLSDPLPRTDDLTPCEKAFREFYHKHTGWPDVIVAGSFVDSVVKNRLTFYTAGDRAGYVRALKDVQEKLKFYSCSCGHIVANLLTAMEEEDGTEPAQTGNAPKSSTKRDGYPGDKGGKRTPP
jgi:hypothetical protein